MDLGNRTAFTDVDHALEEAQFLVEKENIAYCIIRVYRGNDVKLFVVPADSVMEVQIIETFNPVNHGTRT